MGSRRSWWQPEKRTVERDSKLGTTTLRRVPLFCALVHCLSVFCWWLRAVRSIVVGVWNCELASRDGWMDERSAALGGELAVGSTAEEVLSSLSANSATIPSLRHTTSHRLRRWSPVSQLPHFLGILRVQSAHSATSQKMRRWTSGAQRITWRSNSASQLGVKSCRPCQMDIRSHSGVFHRSLQLEHFGILGPIGCVRQG